ncbi:hypothetical protein GCM10023189_30670 [Nibrella saemangeumensis]|uniref:Peptidase metallopeptidase domain-containing protein n=1 Tax=Nibrella saemangeumensis TaxID=1084526 RepID=A0ABP8N1S9_9BACT
MAKRKKATSPEEASSSSQELEDQSFSYCSLPEIPERVFGPDVIPDRAELIVATEKKWVNGTVLHYYFFDKPTDGTTVRLANGTTSWRTWTTTEAEKNVVRRAFQLWKDVGTGLEFTEVATREEAEIRIGFMRGDGAWSYIGRDILDQGVNERTMNFGWDLTRRPSEIDTAIHEIGHTLGFPHEHQNPYAGIVWNEEAVYTALAQPPNNWSRQTTFHNIIRKISPDTVQGSNWDPDSVMHYPFGPGLIQEPAQYRNGLTPAGGLSERDTVWMKTFYPVLTPADYTELKPFQSVELNLAPQEQRNFVIQPTATRRYEMRTFGESDTVMVLFEEIGGELSYVTGDDDSGEDYNAYIKIKLFKGRKYVLRIRLYYAQSGQTAVMLW